MRNVGTVIALAGTFALSLSISASAAVVQGTGFSGELEIIAEPGEANDLTITSTRSGATFRVTVIENGTAPLSAGDPCTETETGVTCDIPGFRFIRADLGDESDGLKASGLAPGAQITADFGPGDDRVIGPPGDLCADGEEGDDFFRLTGPTGACQVSGDEGDDRIIAVDGRNYLRGGDGNDVIFGSDTGEDIDGGAGEDTLLGGGGGDFIDDGSGADEVFGAAGNDYFGGGEGSDVIKGGGGRDVFRTYVFPDGSDVLNGGPGLDLYSMGLCGSCNASLDGQANDGHPGEADNALVEDVIITSSYEDEDTGLETFGTGEDVIVGNNGANFLDGRRGADLIDGRGGPDVLVGGTGFDDIRARDGVRDRIFCGPGEDSVRADRFDTFKDCERVGIAEPRASRGA